MRNVSEPLVVDLADHEVGSRIRRGLAWKLMSQVGLQASRVVVTIVLARVLTPHDFGIAGMVLVLSAFVIPFADLGMGAALVQRPTLDERDRSTIFWASVGAGAFFSAVGIAASPLVARFYGHQTIGPLFAVLSLNFLITSLGATHRSLLVRRMDFRSLELRLLVGIVAGAGAGIGLALGGFGAWALVAQDVVGASVSTILLWVLNPWRPRFVFARRSLTDLGGFGLRSLTSESFTRLTQNADNVLIGRFLGAAPLGLYALAYSAMIAPISRLVAPIQEVLYPAFSRLQRDRTVLTRMWLDAMKGVCLLCLPVMFGLIVIAPDFVPTVFGAHWRASAPVLQVLAVVGALQCIQSQNAGVLRALDRTGMLLRLSTISFAVNIAAFAIGLHWGIIGVASGFAIATSLVCTAFTAVVARAIGVSPSTVLANVAGVVAAAAAMGCACVGARELLLTESTVGTPLRLVLVVAVGALVFAPLALLLNRNLARRLLSGARAPELVVPDL
jgi:O-antigen/teichoic acid export membrane protein